jgi:hypothetical protein
VILNRNLHLFISGVKSELVCSSGLKSELLCHSGLEILDFDEFVVNYGVKSEL